MTMAMRKIAILASSVVPPYAANSRDNGQEPRHRVRALAEGLGAEVIDPVVATTALGPLGWVRRLLGTNVLIAWVAFRRRREFSVILSMGERTGIPLAILLRISRRGARHIMIAHRVSARRKRIVIDLFRLHRTIDVFLVYSRFQARFIRKRWAPAAQRVVRLEGFVDTAFFQPPATSPGSDTEIPARILAVGMESRDYETLLRSVSGLDALVIIKASSPWACPPRETEPVAPPPNVSVLAEPATYEQLRSLYASSRVFVMPLLDCDYAAGITSIGEAMAMGLPVVCTEVAGLRDTVVDGVTGKLAPPGDSEALRAAIVWMLAHPQEAGKMGLEGRRRAEALMRIDIFLNSARRAVSTALGAD